MGDESVGSLAQGLLAAGKSAQGVMDYVSAYDFFSRAEEAARAANEPLMIAAALVELAGNVGEYSPPDVPDTLDYRRSLCERAINLLRSNGSGDRILSRALCLLSAASSREDAAKLLEEALSISRRLGDTEGVIRALERLGHRSCVQGDRAHGVAMKEDALQLARTLGDPRLTAAVLFSVALTNDGTANEQAALYDEAASIYRGIGQLDWVARCLVSCACLAFGPGEHDRKTRYLEDALSASCEIGNDIIAAVCRNELSQIAVVKEMER